MSDLRTIVAAVISGAPFPSKRSQNKAIDILDAIEAVGYRILGPDEVDQVTVEKCAEVAERMLRFADTTSEADIAISEAIRALGRKA